MLTNPSSFEPALEVTAKCPRCHAVGLVVIDYEIYAFTPIGNRHQAAFLIDPSVPARCPACELVMEWPGCAGD